MKVCGPCKQKDGWEYSGQYHDLHGVCEVCGQFTQLWDCHKPTTPAVEHTPVPWEFRVYAEGCLLSSTQMIPGSLTRAALMGVRVISAVPIDDDQSNLTDLSPDAEFIFRACNSHDAMLEALQDIVEQLETTILPIGVDVKDSIRYFCKPAIKEATKQERL